MTHDFTRPMPWQQDLWLELTTLVLQQRLSHALLFCGAQGIGKRQFVRAFAAFLACEQRSGYACGQCRSCLQLGSGTQPNVSTLSVNGLRGLALTPGGHSEQGLIHHQPESETRREIPVDSVRKLIDQLTLSAHYGSTRVALIDAAEQLSISSVNALLKTIEEPPAQTHLLLLSERAQSLLATLRSRCQRILMPRPDAATALAWLREQLGFDGSEALDAAHGAPVRALQLAQSDALAQQKVWRQLWQDVGLRRVDPLTAAASVDREQLAVHLDWALGWLSQHLRQAMLARAGAETLDATVQMLDTLLDARRRAATSANAQLLLESLLVQWLRLGARVLDSRAFAA
ncbi:hypothetical protein [Sinimarinibacterium sp. NLF-5-8]|uniref:hypothetical protein n=1 Tax=Sinimarinibacterium sp. NLF-5-8 TaxID=2698684 RepID=UPI00137BCAD6|nr:hypothetical protein [Sinimarinibacterium sp. NLF-5-8]QHS09491.1 hypothetical protein GT972_04510 [Sinimarinibacterium sp. NLF-5-8]